MTTSERISINQRIDFLIGSREQFRQEIEKMDLCDRIKEREQYNKIREKLEKIAEKYGEKALIVTLIQDENSVKGVTACGKTFFWTPNCGLEKRSRYCGSLYIDGIGTIFTSGTITKVFEYILNN